MNEFYIEQLVKQKTSAKSVLIKIGLIILTILAVFFGISLPFGVIIPVLVIVLDIWLFKKLDLEFEYLYMNGDLDIDKIMSKESRKRVFSTNMKEVEFVAPEGSPELYRWKDLKVLDYSSSIPEQKKYELVGQYKGQMVRVLFEPNESLLNAMRMNAPRKVIF